MRAARYAVLLAIALAVPPARADMVAQGRYLAVLGDCAGCHTAPHGAPFAGGVPFSAQFGTLYSTNISPDRQTGIGGWTSAQFYHALHDGVAPGGKNLYPAFPYIYFRSLSRADTDALFAFLRTQKPVRSTPPPGRLYFPFNIRALMTFWNMLFLDRAVFRADPARSPQWNRGAFIVQGLGHCGACHTPKNILFGDETGRAFTGAVVEDWFSANLTGNAHDGLGSWSRNDIAQYLATGRNRYAVAAGTMQEKVSSSTSRMTEADRNAIAVYLKSLPGRGSLSLKKPDAAVMRQGEAMFAARCQVCHAPVGAPDRAPPDYPRLAGDTLVMGRDPTTVVRIVLEGASSPTIGDRPAGFSMPGFTALADNDVAAVATYIRNAWGNNAPAVDARDVAALRRRVTLPY